MSQETTTSMPPSTPITQGNTPAVQGHNTRPRPARPAGYWERIDAIVATAPPLENWQRAAIRAAFHTPTATREAA